MSQPVIVGRDLEKNYGDVRVLGGVNIEFEPGFHLIKGKSGQGKTTLLLALAGLARLDRGVVTHRLPGQQEKRVITDDESRDRGPFPRLGDLARFAIGRASTKHERQLTAYRARHVGIIPAQPELIPSQTITDNVRLPHQAETARFSEEEEAWVAMLADQLAISALMHRYPHELSKGQQERASILRALGRRKDLVFADEPTSALDPENTEIVNDLFRSLADNEGITTIAVSHIPEAADYAHSVTDIRDINHV